MLLPSASLSDTPLCLRLLMTLFLALSSEIIMLELLLTTALLHICPFTAPPKNEKKRKQGKDCWVEKH